MMYSQLAQTQALFIFEITRLTSLSYIPATKDVFKRKINATTIGNVQISRYVDVFWAGVTSFGSALKT